MKKSVALINRYSKNDSNKKIINFLRYLNNWRDSGHGTYVMQYTACYLYIPCRNKTNFIRNTINFIFIILSSDIFTYQFLLKNLKFKSRCSRQEKNIALTFFSIFETSRFLNCRLSSNIIKNLLHHNHPSKKNYIHIWIKNKVAGIL